MESFGEAVKFRYVLLSSGVMRSGGCVKLCCCKFRIGVFCYVLAVKFRRVGV